METIKAYEERLARYTIEELDSVLCGIDKEKYPDRHQAAIREMEERTRGGELISRKGLESFLAKSVPLSVAVSMWWCFTWRMIVVQFVVFIPINALLLLFAARIGVGKGIDVLLLFMTAIILNIFFGIFFMRQALAKRYSSFDVFLRKRNNVSELTASQSPLRLAVKSETSRK